MWDSDFCVGIMGMKNDMDLSFVLLIWTMVWYDEATLCYPVHRAESRGAVEDAHVLGVGSDPMPGDYFVEILMYCNCIRGLHREQWGCFLVSVRILGGGAHFFTVSRSCASSSLVLFTSSGRRNIHVPFLCSMSRVPPLNLSRYSPRPGA